MGRVAPEMGGLEMASDSEMGELIEQGLSKLKARERRAVELWSEGMSNRAIAGELQTTVGAVKMLLYRTMLKLRRIVGTHCCEA